jgi:hypothetical protein
VKRLLEQVVQEELAGDDCATPDTAGWQTTEESWQAVLPINLARRLLQ